jgi:ankyrin repeat protein
MNSEDMKVHAYAEQGFLDKFKALIHSGACINTQRADGMTPLHIAIIHNHIDLVDYISGHPDVIHTLYTKWGYTPLHEAVKRKSLDSVKILLNNGADTDVYNNDDQTPCQLAQSYRVWMKDSKHDTDIFTAMISLCDKHAYDNKYGYGVDKKGASSDIE